MNPGKVFKDLSWMDFDNIAHGKGFNPTGVFGRNVYIDLDRGICYYVGTD